MKRRPLCCVDDGCLFGRIPGVVGGIKCRVDTLQISCYVNGLIYDSIP